MTTRAMKRRTIDHDRYGKREEGPHLMIMHIGRQKKNNKTRWWIPSEGGRGNWPENVTFDGAHISDLTVTFVISVAAQFHQNSIIIIIISISSLRNDDRVVVELCLVGWLR